jgi:hypothetical protein
VADNAHDPEAFKQKLREWREKGGLNFTFGGRDGYVTREDWHDKPSLKKQENDHVAELTAAGIKFDRYSA